MQKTLVTRAIILAAAVFVVAGVRAAAADDLGNSIKVERLVFPVTLSSGPANVVGYLYYHGSYQNRPLQVAVHGATYNHTYWDFPRVNGEEYSYARYMAAQKYAVLAIDLPGAGESDKPAGQHLGLADTAAAVVQVTAAMKSGNNALGHAFGPVVLVGHSAGSIAATVAQGATQIADALVITGSRHLVGDVLTHPVTQQILPLLLQLVDVFKAVPYFSLPAENRAGLFYYAPAADPDVIALDNATADQWTSGQLLSTFVAFLYPVIDQPGAVTGPVLIQLGTHDVLFPAAFAEDELSLWTATTPDLQILEGMGHDFNLHLGRLASWQGIDAWIAQNTVRK